MAVAERVLMSISAAPLHPAGEQPRASCLQCQERGDSSMKDLYGIRGLGESQMDTVIPPEWVKCPAIKFDGTVPGMEAVRVCRDMVSESGAC